MKRPTGQALLLFSLAAVFLAILAVQNIYLPNIKFAEEEVRTLNSLQEKQLELFLEMNHLLSTLATALFGVMGAFAFNRYKSSQLPQSQIGMAVASGSFSGISLLFGYSSYEAILWMLQKNFFNLSSPYVLVPSTAQFWTFSVSVLTLGAFLYHGIRKED